jgi:hypothetical protein
MRQTEQYRASAEARMLDRREGWHRLEVQKAQQTDPRIVEGLEAQQAAIVLQIKADAGRLDPANVPPAVREFLVTH